MVRPVPGREQTVEDAYLLEPSVPEVSVKVRGGGAVR